MRLGVVLSCLTRHNAHISERMLHTGRAKSMPNETTREVMWLEMCNEKERAVFCGRTPHLDEHSLGNIAPT